MFINLNTCSSKLIEADVRKILFLIIQEKHIAVFLKIFPGNRDPWTSDMENRFFPGHQIQ